MSKKVLNFLDIEVVKQLNPVGTLQRHWKPFAGQLLTIALISTAPNYPY